MSTLTDFEQLSIPLPFDLANGHADQECPPEIAEIMNSLGRIWADGRETPARDLESALCRSFGALIGSDALRSLDQGMISPTASNSIDIVGAYMASEGIETLLLEPAFDNLALLFRRRKASIRPLAEAALADALAQRSLEAVFARNPAAKALFIVNPNNPTGYTIGEGSFDYLCRACEAAGVTLIVDNSFRMFRRNLFDDYAVMIRSGVDFIAFEDTGKCWPTLDLKLSLMSSSPRHLAKLQEIYRELYLGPSLFSVALFTAMFERTREAGPKGLFWNLVDTRRAMLREALRNGPLRPVAVQSWSPLPVEWVNVADTGRIDLDICRMLADEGLGVLPGRHFFWSSADRAPVDAFVRISLLKPAADFTGGLAVLRRTFGAHVADRAVA